MKVAVLLSGGVDSSVALRLLKKEGHDVTAFYLKIWLEDELRYLGDCPWEEDLKFCRAVCKQANVPLKILPLQKEYWDAVVSYTVKELENGRTPNPDVLCNQHIKFGEFYKKIGKEFEKVATGHYAQIEEKNGMFLLKKSKDPKKDQTYFLCRLKQNQLKRALFPIGKFTKQEVRKLAEKFHLPNKNRKDSQGICFLGRIKFPDFVKHHLGEKKGDLANVATGEKMGEHNGFWYFTIGQREGIRLSGGPWYVIKKDVKKNIVYIGHKEQLPKKLRKNFEVKNIHWIAGKELFVTRNFSSKNSGVRIRHGGDILPCSLTLSKNGSSGNIQLKKPRHDLAPGQFAVFYQGRYCMGSGVII